MLPDVGVPLGRISKILHGGQRASVQNGEEIGLLPKVLSPRVGRMNATDDRQTTRGLAIAKTERTVVKR